MTMHDDEVAIDAKLVARLLADQVPDLARLPLREVRSTGTVNAVFRLGENLLVRIPRVPRWAPDLERELTWLPVLGSQLTLPIPRPVRAGSPTAFYPMPWAIYEWIDGSPYSDDGVDDEVQAARDLAHFLTELRGIAPTNAPPAGRRPLRELDAITRDALAASAGVIDATAATAAWDEALETPAWTGAPVWIHTDLLRPNLLVADGRLAAVLDWGGAGVGDPAADVIAAWSVFGPTGRRQFRATLRVDDGTWNRGRGFALHQAGLIIPYYSDTNPHFVRTAVRTVREILSEEGR
ncbi:aminoglycoside phosphotransferase family protein [Mycetocola sp. 2940]|uniref:aminoglycoside phosphotransferase family protein n=1 Tax=Mycetocola sp. 2940 TaxID=3156452 RepID=UPI00339B0FC2